MRLIDADALLEAIRPTLDRLYSYEIRRIESAITNAPTVQREGWEGFSLYFSREEWGAITNGLILERDKSLQRKASNPESNSNLIADTCADILKTINAACSLPAAPDTE